MPSKALLRPIEVLEAARHMPGVASIVGDRSIDAPAVLRRRDSFTSDHDDASQVKWAHGAGIDVVRGHGRLAGEKAVEVAGSDGWVRTLTARHAAPPASWASLRECAPAPPKRARQGTTWPATEVPRRPRRSFAASLATLARQQQPTAVR